MTNSTGGNAIEPKPGAFHGDYSQKLLPKRNTLLHKKLLDYFST